MEPQAIVAGQIENFVKYPPRVSADLDLLFERPAVERYKMERMQ
jgi:hypothetical protein